MGPRFPGGLESFGGGQDAGGGREIRRLGVTVVTAAVETLVMAQHKGGDWLAVLAQRREGALAVVGMEPHGIRLARGEGAGPHPGRNRDRQFADVMGAGCPANGANVRRRKADAPARRFGKAGDGARMAVGGRHPHVDHVGDRQKGLVAAFLVERRVGERLERQNRLAVDRPIESFEQACGMSEKQIGQLRLIGAATAPGDHRRHGLEAMRLA